MHKLWIAISAVAAGIAAASDSSAQTAKLPFEGTWRQRPNESCEFATTITKGSVTERRPGSSDTYRIVAVKRRNEMVYELSVRVDDNRGHGQPTRNQILRIEIENGDAFNASGPYFEGQQVEYVRCPDPLANGAASGRSPEALKPKSAARCNISAAEIKAAFDRESYQLRERIKAEFMRFGYLPKPTSCANMRHINAFHQSVIKRVSACEAMPNRSKIVAEHRGYIAKNNNSIHRNGWCG